MATVLRVKRRAEESPQEALVLLSKRLKIEAPGAKEDSDLALNVFVFSETVSEQDNISSHVRNLISKSETRSHELSAVKNTKEILDKMRKERKEISHASRYEILNLSRGLTEKSKIDSDYALVDIAKTSLTEEQDVKYAYDLYFSQKKDFDLATLDDVVRIEDLECQLMFGSYRDNGRRTPSDDDSVSSDDSNDENNWRNDYPDEDECSIGEEDMRRTVEDIDIGNDLSSDADEEEIYNEPSVDLGELNSEDVQRYGPAYAKYKAKVLAADNESNLVTSTKVASSDSESSDGYKDEEDTFYYGMEEDNHQFVEQYPADHSDDDVPD